MLKIPDSIFQEIRRHGEESYPHECCGVLLGEVDLDVNERRVSLAIRCGNMRTDSAHNRYLIDDKELLAAQKTARERGNLGARTPTTPAVPGTAQGGSGTGQSGSGTGGATP